MTASGFMRHTQVILRPDAMRTVLRPFDVGDVEGYGQARSRKQRIADRVLALDDAELGEHFERVMQGLNSRHRDVETKLMERFDEVKGSLSDGADATGQRALLIGAYFSEEFSFESAALFNPSVVAHPDQSGVAEGGVKILVSLRGIGEGHVSSLTFRSGAWNGDGEVTIDELGPYAVGPKVGESQTDSGERRVELHCGGGREITETVIFPFLPSQGRGLEDVRLVQFTDDDGTVDYRGTFTAFSGSDVREVLLRTADFRTIEMRGVEGPYARAKGMALFPRRIDGRFHVVSRQDNENLWLLSSDDFYKYEGGVKLLEPKYPWEFVQMGNCGSPIEVDEGWILLTHGVGEVRTYCMGACLLDKADPSKVLARTQNPILQPEPNERDGYVPNVVYSCGAMLRGRELLIPFGVADNFAAFGTMKVDDLLAAMS